MPRETEKHSLMMIDGKQIGGPRPGGRNQDGHGMTKSDFFLSLRIWHPRRGNCCVCDGWCIHTRCRTHIFLTHFPCAWCTDIAYAWLKVFAVRMSYLSISPSPFSCFIRFLCCSRTVTSTPRSRLHFACRTVPDSKARVKRTSGYEPKEFDKFTSVDGDTTLVKSELR